jgi:hypothetical protein
VLLNINPKSRLFAEDRSKLRQTGKIESAGKANQKCSPRALCEPRPSARGVQQHLTILLSSIHATSLVALTLGRVTREQSLVLTTSFGGVTRAASPIAINFFRQPVGAALLTSVSPSSVREGEVSMVLVVSLSNFPRLDAPVDAALVSFRVGGLSGSSDQVCCVPPSTPQKLSSTHNFLSLK